MKGRRAAATTACMVTVVVLSGCGGDDTNRPAQSRRDPPRPGARAPHDPAPAPRVPQNVYAGALPGAFSPAVTGIPARVYVPNSGSGTVDVIDPTTFAVVDRFPVGRLPQHVTPAWDLRQLYVDNDLSDSLTPVDPRTGRPGAAIPITDPYNVYFTVDGSRAIVVAERRRRLDFRDPHSWALVKTVPIPHAGADHLDFSADGRTLLLSAEFSGWLVRLDVRRMAITGELHVGGSPVDVKLAPDGSVFYVANQTRDGVSVIDPVALRETAFIHTGRGAHGLFVSRDTRSLYVSNRREGSISVVDLARRRVAATWAIGGSPDMGGVSADGSQLWVTGRYDSAVYVVDTRTGALTHTIRVGAGPHGLCVFPQPGRVSLGHTGVYR